MRLDDLLTQEASHDFRHEIWAQEKQIMQQQIECLSKELDNKSEELLAVKKGKASTVSDLESRLTAKDHEVGMYRGSV